MERIKKLYEGLIEAPKEAWEALKSIARFFEYLMNPKLILIAIWNCIELYSLLICIGLALFGIIAYAFGYKKYAKLTPASVAIYTLIKALGAING